MIHASAIAESIVAPTLFRPGFSHRLDPKRTFGFFPIGRNIVFAKAEITSPDDVQPNLSGCRKKRPPEMPGAKFGGQRAYHAAHLAASNAVSRGVSAAWFT